MNGKLENKQPEDNTGRKNDTGKTPLALIPTVALDAEGQAFADGLRKYGMWNYMRGMSAIRLASAVQRHITAWLDGELSAPDSGIHHLGHARAGLAMLMKLEQSGKLIDDRWTGEAPDALPGVGAQPAAPVAVSCKKPADRRTIAGGGKLQLQVGKWYTRRDGRFAVQIVSGSSNFRFSGVHPQPFVSGSGPQSGSQNFGADGSYMWPGTKALSDLVEEVDPPVGGATLASEASSTNPPKVGEE